MTLSRSCCSCGRVLEKAELQRRFTGAELPFQFGYAQSGGHGVLQTAWRKETA